MPKKPSAKIDEVKIVLPKGDASFFTVSVRFGYDVLCYRIVPSAEQWGVQGAMWNVYHVNGENVSKPIGRVWTVTHEQNEQAYAAAVVACIAQAQLFQESQNEIGT